MSAAPNIPLSKFLRGHSAASVPASSRVIAGALTAVLYALFAVLTWLSFLTVPVSHATSEITAKLLPDVPEKKLVPLPPPFLAHLIRPRPESIAPPTFTVASAAPVAPALLPASAAKTSPITGGVPAGTGAKGAGASANGSDGNGNTLAGCFDPVWRRAVTERVRQFFHYPATALSSHTTGVAIVHFIVRRDGLLDMLEIGKSSGDDALDEAAYNMVRKAQPLPAIPHRMHTDRVEGNLPIDFGVPGFNLEPTAGNCG